MTAQTAPIQDEQQKDEWLTLAEVAELQDRHHATVWRWCCSGKIAARYDGNRWQIRRSVAESFVPPKSGPKTGGAA